MTQTFKEIIGIIGVLLTIPGYYVYIKSILEGKTKPHIYSKIVWSVLLFVGFFIQYFDGGGPGAWILGITAIGQFVITLLSIKYGTKDITKFDTFLLLLALCSIVLYIWVDDKLYSLLIIIFTDIIGFIPTIRKTIKDPYSEILLAYNITTLKMTLSIIALINYSILTVLYPLSIVICNIFFVGIIMYKRKSYENKK